MNFVQWIAALTCAFFVTTGVAHARAMGNDPGAAAAATFSFSGTISAINLGTNTLTIDGKRYVFAASSIKLQNPKPGISNATQLRPGMQIGFNVAREGAQLRITDVWLLN